MNEKYIDAIVWFIPFKNLRNSVRILLNGHFNFLKNINSNIENINSNIENINSNIENINSNNKLLNYLNLYKDNYTNLYFNTQNKDYGTIFDIGMNNGSDTEFYLKKGFKVVAVEANPLLVAEAYKKFDKYILNGRLVIYNNGITDEKDSGKILNFYVNPIDEWSSFIEEIGNRKASWLDTAEEVRVIQVKMISIRDLFEKHGIPYYLKIDVEGYDGRLLQSMKYLQTEMPKYISVESIGHLDSLVSLGAKFFKIVNQKENPRIDKLPIPPREGVFLTHTFIEGSSGPFGDEIEGDWLSYEETLNIIENMKKYHIEYSWYDMHAKFY